MNTRSPESDVSQVPPEPDRREGDTTSEARPHPARLTLIDIGLAAGTFVVATAALFLGEEEPTARDPDAFAVALVLAASIPIVIRRRWPVLALGLTSVLTMALLSLDYAGGTAHILLLVPLYHAAAVGHRLAAFLAVGFFAGGGLIFRIVIENESPFAVTITSALYVAVALHGDAVHSRRELKEATRETVRLAVREREREAEQRLTKERVRFAQELHDVMAHTITSMTVMIGAASDVLPDRPDQAAETLREARRTAKQAMDALRASIDVLREGTLAAQTEPVPGLALLDSVLALAREDGIEVELDLPEDVNLPPALDLTALRVIQEAVTNTVRHAGASKLRVVIKEDADFLRITVADDGLGPRVDTTMGYGLSGMWERVHAMGGVMHTDRSDLGGFLVEVRIPVSP